jgi:acylphosphatase
MTNRVHFRLYGGVQGVGFRYFTAQLAHDMGLAGYVRNLADGSVEVEAEGDPVALARFRQHVRSGPPHASVREVLDLPLGAAALQRPFIIMRTTEPFS